MAEAKWFSFYHFHTQIISLAQLLYSSAFSEKSLQELKQTNKQTSEAGEGTEKRRHNYGLQEGKQELCGYGLEFWESQ